MKRKFTFLIAAMALMIAIIDSGAEAWGQESTDEVYKTALFGSSYNSGGIGNYTSSWYATNNGFRVDLVYFNNNNNNWSYVKCGNKSNASVATITTHDAIDKAVTKVAITIDAIIASSVNSITLYSGTSSESITNNEGTFSKSSGVQTVSIASPGQNKFYKIAFDCKKGSSNGLVTISKVEYYKEKILKVETPTFNPTAGEYIGTQNVTISTETAGATIYYNFTGEEPWTEYTNPVAVSETSTLYAYATKTDYEDSEIASAEYTISSTITLDAPTLTVTPGNAKVTPTWTAIEHASSYTIEYATDSEFTSSETIDNATSGTEITDLTNETPYYFRIKSIGDGVTYMSSDWSATVSATPSSLTTMSIDFESASSTYTDWTFTNMTSQQSGAITTHGGSKYGTTGGKATASITTKNKIANPQTFTCYVSKTTNNTSASSWIIQVSENGSSWTDVETQDASSMDKGEWVEFSQDLSSYHNVYVRIYYDGSTAVRAIDDLSLTYAPAEYKTLAVANVDNGTISATIGTTTVTEGNSINDALVNATVTLTQENETGYTFGEWDVYKTDESSTKVTVTNNSFEMPDYDVTVSATFVEVQTYAITIDGNITNGSVTSDKATAAQGETVTLTAIPNAGYFFDTWNVTYIDGESQTQTITVTNNAFSMPAYPVTVSATFVERPAATFTNGIYTESFASQESFNNWYAYSVSGNETWEYSSYGAYIKGNSKVNEDWLVSQKMSIENGKLAIDFNCVGRYGAEGSITAYYSVDYPGTGNPNNYTWTEIETTPQIPYAADDWNMVSVSCNISTANAYAYFAFKYTSTTESSGTFEMKPFTAKQYFAVTYNNNGGSGEMTDANSPYVVGTEVTTLVNTFTAPVATPHFVNWNTEADGSGVEYNEETSFNMPAQNVTLYAQWTNEKVITIDQNIQHGTVTSSLSAAAPGTEVTLTATPASNYSFDSWNVYKTGEPTITVTVTDDKFTMPDYGVTVSATFVEKAWHYVTWNVNGILTQEQYHEDEAITFSNNPSNIPTGTTFAGWSATQVLNIVDEKPEVVTEANMGINDITYYALLQGAEAKTQTLQYDTWTYGGSTTDKSTYRLFHATGFVESTAFDLNTLTKVIVYGGTYGGDSFNSLTIGDGTDTWKSVTVVGKKETGQNIYTDGTALSGTGKLYVTSNSGTSSGTGVRISKIEIFTKDFNGYTTNVDMIVSTNKTIANLTISSAQHVTIKNGATLTITGTLTNSNPANLIIEDGGQLILNNAGVKATAQKHVEKSEIAGKVGESNTTWYSISSPLVANVEFEDVENLIPTSVTATDYDLYRLNEAEGKWENTKISEETASTTFTTIDKGRGYIYSRHADGATDIAFAGEINVADVECTLTNGATNGFNLIGNPFMQNIALTNVESQGTTALANGFYVLNHNDSWGTKIESGNIAPLQGFLVQATTAGKVTINKPTSGSKGERSEQNANIEIIVSNSNYSDNAYAMFSDGIGLNKISHRNADAPMVYIPQNNENFAIVTMDESVTLFPVNFKAMTTGYYTISLKSSQIYEGYNDFDYLHLIDNMTGEEIDMLLEDGYKFVGSPRDNENRFTVKLHRNGVEENEAEDINFVYQNGNSLVVSGEGTFQLIDMLGRVVISREIHGETVSVDNLITGAYIVRMIGNEVKTQKIVIK